MANTGKVKQVIGAAIDVQFDGKLPKSTIHWNLKENVTYWCWKYSSTWGRQCTHHCDGWYRRYRSGTPLWIPAWGDCHAYRRRHQRPSLQCNRWSYRRIVGSKQSQSARFTTCRPCLKTWYRGRGTFHRYQSNRPDRTLCKGGKIGFVRGAGGVKPYWSRNWSTISQSLFRFVSVCRVGERTREGNDLMRRDDWSRHHEIWWCLQTQHGKWRMGPEQSEHERTGWFKSHFRIRTDERTSREPVQPWPWGLIIAEYYRDGDGQGKGPISFSSWIISSVSPRQVLKYQPARTYASAVGYQPTLATEMGIMQERITSTKNGSSHPYRRVCTCGWPYRSGAGNNLCPPGCYNRIVRKIADLAYLSCGGSADSTSRILSPLVVGEAL